MSLNITTETEGSKATICIDGRLAYDTSPELDEVFKKLPEEVCDIVCDLKYVSYVSSAGLRAFVRGMRIADSRGGSFKIMHVTNDVYDVFRMTGLVPRFSPRWILSTTSTSGSPWQNVRSVPSRQTIVSSPCSTIP